MQVIIPFTSQKNLDENWRHRGCGITALKMMLDYWRTEFPLEHTLPLPELLLLGVNRGAYVEGIGWTHAGLASLARELGYEAFNRDFGIKGKTPKSGKDAFAILKRDVASGPVIASIWKDFTPKGRSGHLVVVTRISASHIEYIDPEEVSVKKASKSVSHQRFTAGFRHFSIVVRPTDRYRTYLSVVDGNVGSSAYKHLWGKVSGEDRDITKNGVVSCAFFVSFVLSGLQYLHTIHANVDSTVGDLERSGWKKIKTPRAGAVVVWEAKLQPSGVHKHIGFVVDSEHAISTDPVNGVPTKSHITFGTTKGKPNRAILALYWRKGFPKAMSKG